MLYADLCHSLGLADYLFVNRTTGSVILYLNTGVGDVISWAPANDGKEIASGLAPRDLVRFVDIGKLVSLQFRIYIGAHKIQILTEKMITAS